MTTEHATYQLASGANYKFDIVKMGYHNYDPSAYYHKENFPDVKITRPGTDTDLMKLHNEYLMTVNGYVFPTHVIGDEVFIPQATISMLRSRSNAIGMIHLKKLSDNITRTKITNDMLSIDPVMPAYEKIIITSPTPLVRPILIMAGYMVFENPEYFYRVSDHAFALRLDRLQYAEKLYELHRYRDIFKDIGVPVSPSNDSMVDASVIRSELTIKRFLTLHNSFIVDLNTDNLSVSKVFMERTSVPLNYRTEHPPIFPLCVGYGKLSEYFHEDAGENKNTIATQDSYYNNHLFGYQSYKDIAIYNNHRKPGSTYRLSPAFFLDISVDK